MNAIEKEDCSHVIEHCNVLSNLHNKTVFITGATGFIGTALINTILIYNSLHASNIQIIALVRSKEKAYKKFSDCLTNQLNFIEGVVENLPEITAHIDYIIHGASATSSFDFVQKPVDTIQTTIQGTQNILQLALRNKVKSLIYLSSMEVYGIQEKIIVNENDYGYIDILQTRSSYSQSKRMAETMCLAYAYQFNVSVKIARLTQTIGPGFNYNDTRIAALFARAVLENKNIILHTTGLTTRNILYSSDAVNAIFIILCKGLQGEAYNVANSKEILSVVDTANMIASKIAQNKIKVEYIIKDMPEYEANKTLNLHLNTEKLESLGWKAYVGIEEAYRRMISGMNL